MTACGSAFRRASTPIASQSSIAARVEAAPHYERFVPPKAPVPTPILASYILILLYTPLYHRSNTAHPFHLDLDLTAGPFYCSPTLTGTLGSGARLSNTISTAARRRCFLSEDISHADSTRRRGAETCSRNVSTRPPYRCTRHRQMTAMSHCGHRQLA
jgi:hypothetical protein